LKFFEKNPKTHKTPQKVDFSEILGFLDPKKWNFGVTFFQKKLISGPLSALTTKFRGIQNMNFFRKFQHPTASKRFIGAHVHRHLPGSGRTIRTAHFLTARTARNHLPLSFCTPPPPHKSGIFYCHYKCELVLLMPIAESGSASMPVAFRVLLRPILDMLGFQVTRLGEKVQGERVLGFLNGDFKWGF